MNAKLHFINNTKLQPGLMMFVFNIFFFLFQINPIQATHIVGGQLTYRNLGKNHYEVSLVFRRDCSKGTEPFDSIALLGVFFTDNQKAYTIGYDGVIPMKLNKVEMLHDSVPNLCVGEYEPVCVEQTIYKDTIYLPQNTYHKGYILAYQRCCRNDNLSNIEKPLETGSTYTVTISDLNLVEGNSNPDFGDKFPPIYICANKPFVFNHSVIDYDGDSLVYTLCTPYSGKTDSLPSGRPSFPPYDTVIWKSPYSLNNLLGSPLTIDPATGKITATPQITGQFLVGVCIYEYRKGLLIGYARRDFELNIVACGKKPDAKFERTSALCDGLKVSFNNLSTDGIDFSWYFDWLNDRSQTSTVFNPTHTYSKAGEYEIVLIAKHESCSDTTRLIINVIDPKLNPDFDYTIDCKKSVNIQITDKSTANGQIISRQWMLTGSKDTILSNLKDPLFNLKGDGKLTIKLIITDTNGCTATISKDVIVNLVNIHVIADSITICRGDSTKLLKDPDIRFQYQWDPKNTLDLRNPSDPIAKPTNTTTYKVTITDGPCSTVKQVTVFVRDKIHVSITGDTTACDGKVNLLAKSDSATVFIWSVNPNFIPVLFTGDHLVTTINGTTTFHIKGGTGEQCQDSTSITVTVHSVNLKFNKEYTACAGDTFHVQITNLNPSDQLMINWLPNPVIIGPTDILNPTISCPAPGRYVLYFNVKNQYGCNHSDSIIVNAVLAPNPEFDIDDECGSLIIKVNTNSHGSVSWDFGDGIGSSHDKSTSYKYNKHGKYVITLTVDSICVRSLTKEITVVELTSNLSDTIISCLGDSVHLNPGANPNYHYEWTPAKGLNDPKSPNPIATVSSSTKYYVTITDPDFPDSCSLKDSICVFVPTALTLKTGPDTILCEKTKITLRVTSNLNGTEFEWCDEFNHPIGKTAEIEVTPDKSTYYIIKATDQYGCKARDTIFVELFELDAFLSGPDILCIGDTTFIKVNAGPGTNYHYEWLPKEFIIGSNTDSIIYVNPDKATTYTVKIINDHNCEWDLSKTIQVNNPKLKLTVKADPSIIVPSQKTQLTATFNSSWKYLWKPQDGSLSDSSIYNPIATPLVTTSYTVTVTDEAGCTATDVVTVTVLSCEESVFLPTAFSPNDDKINDVLYVRSRPNTVTKMELVIYNRWGRKMFSTTDISIGWDGRFDGEILPPDVFGYGLRFFCHENREYFKKGNVSIIK